MRLTRRHNYGGINICSVWYIYSFHVTGEKIFIQIHVTNVLISVFVRYSSLSGTAVCKTELAVLLELFLHCTECNGRKTVRKLQDTRQMN